MARGRGRQQLQQQFRKVTRNNKTKWVAVGAGGATALVIAIALALRGRDDDGLPGGLFAISLSVDRTTAPAGQDFIFTAHVTQEPQGDPAGGIDVYLKTVPAGGEGTAIFDLVGTTDSQGGLVFAARDFGVGSYEITVVTHTQNQAESAIIPITETAPGCQPFYRMDDLGTCVPRLPEEGMILQDLGIEFNYNFGYTGGKWRVEGFVERTTPDPYPVWILTRWIGPDGVIVYDEKGGSNSGLEGPTEIADMVGDTLTTNPAVWGQTCRVEIYVTNERNPIKYEGSLEYNVEGMTWQHIASRTFTPTEDEA